MIYRNPKAEYIRYVNILKSEYFLDGGQFLSNLGLPYVWIIGLFFDHSVNDAVPIQGR